MQKKMEIVITFEQLEKELNLDAAFKIVKIYQKKEDIEKKLIRLSIEQMTELELNHLKQKEADLSFLDGFTLRQLEMLKKAIEVREEIRKIDGRKIDYSTLFTGQR